MINWDKYRKEFPILETYSYFNTARFCALPNKVVKIQKRYLEGLAQSGSWNFEEWSHKYEEAREKTAQLISCSRDNTFFIPNVSTGINLASIYLPNKKVVLIKDDFPSVTLPWHSHGFEAEELDYLSDGFYEDLEKALKSGGKILCVSWIQSKDGFEIDLSRIFEWAKKYNISIVLDGTQGLGAIPFHVDPEVSMVFLASSFKWLLSGYGVAIGYVSDDLLPKFKAFQGWNSIDFGTGHAKTGAASLEVGNALFLNVLGLNEGLKMIATIGVDEIYKRNTLYTEKLLNTLKQANRTVLNHETTRSSIFRIGMDEGEYEKLESASIQSSNQGRYIRLSPHFYNNDSDIQRLLEVLE